MKIAIYGDSYADFYREWKHTWEYYLREMLGVGTDIHNYAKGGSSLYFSYKTFVETRDLYDLVIFLVTEPHRYPIKFKPSQSKQTHYITCSAHVEQIEKNSEALLTVEEKKFLSNLKGWFGASSDEYNVDMADIIVDNIERMHGNIILYPCFFNSLKKERFKKYNLDPILHPMHSFWHRQLELLGIDPNNFTALEKHTLAGHLTPEFNKYFAKVLHSKITKGVWDHSGFFDVVIEHPKTHYYKNWD